jgi:CRISPR-associated protein Csm4
VNVEKYLSDKDDSLGRYLQNGAVWIAKDDQKDLPETWRGQQAKALKSQKVWDIQLTPRVSIDRLSNYSNIYHIGRTVFAPECGLWFVAEMINDDVQAWFENILTYLQDDGIGGERSAGYGAFVWESMSPPCQPSTDSEYVMLLSRYHPTPQELQNSVLIGDLTSYELVDVGGYVTPIGEPARKRQRVRLIEAGSVVRGGITGQLVDVSPTGFQSHAVYRSGIALAIPVNRKGKS